MDEEKCCRRDDPGNKLVVALVAVFCLALFAAPPVVEGRKPDAAPRSAAQTRVVGVAFDADAVGLSEEAVVQALAAHIEALGFVVRAGTTNGVRVELSRTPSGNLRVHVWPPDAKAPWSREIPDGGDADLLLESLGVVVRGALSALEPANAAPEEAPRGEPSLKPVVSTPARSPPQLDLAVAYRGESFAPQQPWHHGARLSLEFESSRGATVELAGAWIPPHRSRVGVSVQRIPIDIAAGWRARSGQRFRPTVVGLATIEAIGWSGAGSRSEPRPGWAARVGLGVGGGFVLELAGGAYALGRIAARGWPLGAELVREGPTGRERLLKASVVSGEVLVGFGYHLLFIRNRRQPPTTHVGGP